MSSDLQIRKNCLVCLENSTSTIGVFSQEGIEMKINEIVCQHFWFNINKNEFTAVCLICWKLIREFHKFYNKIAQIHGMSENTIIKHSLSYDDINVKDEIGDNYNTTNQIKLTQNENIIFKNEVVPETNHLKTFLEMSLDVNEMSDNSLQNISINAKVHNSDDGNEIVIGSDEYSNSYERTSDANDEGENELLFKNKSKTINQVEIKRRDQEKFQEEENQIRQIANMSCQLCDTVFEAYKDCKPHFRKFHKIDKGYLLCCGTKYSRRDKLIEHIQVHLNPNEFK